MISADDLLPEGYGRGCWHYSGGGDDGIGDGSRWGFDDDVVAGGGGMWHGDGCGDGGDLIEHVSDDADDGGDPDDQRGDDPSLPPQHGGDPR